MRRISLINRSLRLVIAPALLVIAAGCPESPENRGGTRVGVVPVKGVLSINGQTALRSAAKVTLHAQGNQLQTQQGGEPIPNPGSVTDKNGNFQITTFEPGDGAPPGEYKITVTMPAFNAMRGYSGADQLLGTDGESIYGDPETTPLSVTVGDQPVDLGTLEVTVDDVDLEKVAPAPGFSAWPVQ